MPSTWRENGFGIYGNTKLLSYRAYIVNGLKGEKFASKGLRGGRQKGSKALTEHFALTGRVEFTPRPGLILGGSFYAGNSGNGLIKGSKKLGVSTNILEGHIDIRRSGFWISLLAAQAKIGDVTGLNQALGLTGNKSVGETLNGFYLQAGYDLLHRSGYGEKSLMPYMRYEKVNTQASVPSGYNLDPSKNMSSMTLGVAYSPEPRIVFKADYKNANNKAGTGLDQTSLQVGYVF